MNPHALLHRLREAGFRLDVAGEKLLVQPASRLTDADRADIRLHVVGLVQALEADHEWFEERAAVMEFDGGLTRVEAEAAARELLARMRSTAP